MRCFRLVQQSLESDHSLFGLTVTAINYVNVHRCLEHRYHRSHDTTCLDRSTSRSPSSISTERGCVLGRSCYKELGQSKASVVYHIWTTGKIFVYFSISVLLCRYYQRMLSAKLDKLRVASATSPLPTFVLTDAVFNNFRLINDTELPPFVMVDVLDEIVPFLLYLF